MAVPETAVAAIKRFCEAHTPPHLRDQMRLEVGIRGNSVTIWTADRSGRELRGTGPG